MAKLGFVLIVVLFGAAAFGAGLLSPDALRRVATSVVAHITPASAAKKAPAQSAAAGAAAAAGGAAAGGAAAKKKPLPYDTLLVPATPPAGAKYALQLALYEDKSAADALAGRAAGFGYPTRILSVVDGKGAPWLAVAAGSYASADGARAARAGISEQLALTRPLPVILLPVKKKKQ